MLLSSLICAGKLVACFARFDALKGGNLCAITVGGLIPEDEGVCCWTEGVLTLLGLKSKG